MITDNFFREWNNLDSEQKLLYIEFVYVGVFFLLKASMLRRKTSFGWSMSLNNYAQGVVYIIITLLFFVHWSDRTETIIRDFAFGVLAVTVTWSYIELLKPPPPRSFEMERLNGMPGMMDEHGNKKHKPIKAAYTDVNQEPGGESK